VKKSAARSLGARAARSADQQAERRTAWISAAGTSAVSKWKSRPRGAAFDFLAYSFITLRDL
jgi:hypothetical protein